MALRQLAGPYSVQSSEISSQAGTPSLLNVVVVLVHRFHHKLFEHQNRFGAGVVNHKTLNQVVDEHHHWQHSHGDDFKQALGLDGCGDAPSMNRQSSGARGILVLSMLQGLFHSPPQQLALV